MSDKAVFEKATARRDELAKSINDAQQTLEFLRSELRGVDSFINQWKKFAGVVDLEIGRVTVSLTPKSATQGPIRKNSKKEAVAEAAYEFIKELNAPVPRVNLLTLLVNRGLIIEGGDPEVVLSTMLWRMRSRIVRLRKGGYWRADAPSPDGSYVPGQSNDADHLASMTEAERREAVATQDQDAEINELMK